MSVKVTPELSNCEKARTAWSDRLPDWVEILAKACDVTNQRDVGDRLGRSSAYVSRVINCCYTGSYEEAEQLVRSRLAADVVECPVWSDSIPLKACIGNRRRKGRPRTQLHHLYARTCTTCPNNSDIDEVRS